MPIVKNISKNWKKMDGDSLLEKKINAYLTSKYISNECPSDECISYAKKFAKLTPNKKSSEVIKKTIIEYFYTASDLNGKIVNLKVPAGVIESTIEDIFKLIENYKGSSDE